MVTVLHTLCGRHTFDSFSKVLSELHVYSPVSFLKNHFKRIRTDDFNLFTLCVSVYRVYEAARFADYEETVNHLEERNRENPLNHVTSADYELQNNMATQS